MYRNGELDPAMGTPYSLVLFARQMYNYVIRKAFPSNAFEWGQSQEPEVPLPKHKLFMNNNQKNQGQKINGHRTTIIAKQQDNTLSRMYARLDGKMFADSQASWEHSQSDHLERLPYEVDETASARNTLTSFSCDHMNQAWQFDEYINSFNPFQSSSMINNMPIMMFQTPAQAQEEWTSVGYDRSRDFQVSESQAFLANSGQSSYPPEHAGCLDLTSHTNYEAVDAFFLNGVPPATVFPSNPDPVDLATSTQWTRDVFPADPLVYVTPEHPLDSARCQYTKTTPALQPATPRFQHEEVPTMEGFDVPHKIQDQHAQTQQKALNTCQECRTQFQNKARLDSHAKQTQHATYACDCGEKFSRFDVLSRHLDRFDPKAVYTCPYCSQYSDHRLDHLTQHLRGYHKLDVSDSAQDPQLLSTQRLCISFLDHWLCFRVRQKPATNRLSGVEGTDPALA